MRVRSLLSAAILAGAALFAFPPAQADTSARHSPGGSGTDVVLYECKSAGGATHRISVQVELTMPTDAQPGVQMTIGWRGTYDGGSELTAPAGGLDDANMYAYASISGFNGLTSATGVAPLAVAIIPAGAPIPLPAGTVEMRTTANSAGTGTVKPAAINFGPSPTQPVIECEVLNPDALHTYTLTVGTASTPTNTPTNSPAETPTATPTQPDPGTDDDTTAEDNGGSIAKTPVGSAATGGGGEAGPDARLITLTGLVLLLSGVTGLIWRQRRAR